jgi:proline iminopeptidase
MGITRWDILGHSWGGGIGMLAAERDRVGVRRLVLVDSVGASSGWMPDLHGRGLARLDAARRAELDLLDPEDLQKPDPDNHAAYSRAYYPAWFADPQLSQAFTPPRAASRTGAAIVARLRREGYDWTDLIRAIEARTLVLHGELDPLPSTEARQLSALIPDARLVLIPECGHMPFWEAPETFFLLVESFLTAD